jgi:hypothetical protein
MLFVILAISLGLLITVKKFRSSASLFSFVLIVILSIAIQAMGYYNAH